MSKRRRWVSPYAGTPKRFRPNSNEDFSQGGSGYGVVYHSRSNDQWLDSGTKSSVFSRLSTGPIIDNPCSLRFNSAGEQSLRWRPVYQDHNAERSLQTSLLNSFENAWNSLSRDEANSIIQNCANSLNCVNALGTIMDADEMSYRSQNNGSPYRSDHGYGDGHSRGGRGRGRGRGPRGHRSHGSGGWRSNDQRGAQSLDSLYQPPSNETGFNRDESPQSYDRSSPQHMREDFYARGGRGRGRGRGGPSREPSRRQREYPIGRAQLEKLLALPPDVVALELLREQSGYRLLLKEDNIKEDKLFLLIEVLAHATNSKSSQESLYNLFSLTCEQKFMDMLCRFAITVKMRYQDKGNEFFSHLLTFLNGYANAMTTTAIDRLPVLVEGCIFVLKQCSFVSEDLIMRYEALQNMLSEVLNRWQHEKNLDADGRRRHRAEMNDMEPPDDYRKMSVLPTSQDLSKTERPFLRENIVKGKYRDGRHYLDVQFRLLREDFVRPLRNGICDFRGDVKSRFKDIRIYREVTVVGTAFDNRKMCHLVKLNLPRHVKSIENSKRLLYGNLLCLSSDNFKSLIFASVAARDPEMLRKEGIIGVQFESNIEDVDFKRKFVMAESRAYFMAYKHVLKALQDIPDNGVPMEPYIIHVRANVDHPKYLEPGAKYDLRVMKSMNTMKKEEARSRLFDLGDDIEDLEEDEGPLLHEVFIHRDLMTWPSEEELGLDSSQRRALRSALTRQLAIIQGPPGTGKTFMGLKITQILLHNSQVWKDSDHPKPILVVCFTNHALDQFLEGMTPYTKNIVRVGSRTKSDIIGRYQVNNLLRILQGSRGIPPAMHEMNLHLRRENADLERDIEKLRQTLALCLKGQGIIRLDTFAQEKIIPSHLLQQLGGIGLSHWLLLSVNPDEIGKIERQKQQQKAPIVPQSECVPDSTNTDNLIDDEYNDAEELLGQEEQDRLLGDDDSGDEDDVVKSIRVSYDITDDVLLQEMNLAAAAWNEDENNLEAYFRSTILEGQRNALRIGLSFPVNLGAAGALERQPYLNLLTLDFPSRWQLYKYWCIQLEDNIIQALKKLESKYQRKSRALEEIKYQEILYLMRHASVVGMTTTGAAQYSSIMHDLAPSIVIIEEAAEILESHVIISLTSKCQHLIMIGDHQQLRPSATVYELATKFGLETSLFERMIKNGLAYETLEYQHRMRPSISRLLVPNIYEHLKDHPSVKLHPNVKGITKDVFFIDHDIPEREDSDDNNSHENQHEAVLITGLCRHLMLQGYSPDDVTILTPYSGQFFLLRKLLREHTVCQNVKICVVDNFQGEENNIILLSLVRSNAEGKVGFLRTENRVCVALSRAKHGLYITGNMEQLCSSSDLWKKIRNDLNDDGSFGPALTLKCENHPEQLTSVKTGEEFLQKCPEGGCMMTCNKPLPKCGHACPRICHMEDREHILYQCRVPCPKILCELDHPCPKECHEKCSPCKVLVQKLCPCGHTNTIMCHVSPDNFRCQVIVEKELHYCQHVVKMPCYHDTKTFPCPFDCDTRLDCGHQCRQKCHRTKDPDHLNYNCKQPCAKLNAGCTQNHPCQRYCYEDCGNCIVRIDKKQLPCGHEARNVECYTPPEEIKCQKKCKKTLSCGHPCKKLCYVSCGICTVKVKKTVPECQHEVLVECGLPATTSLCEGKCNKKLPCGHPCLEKCKDVCTTKCKELVVTTTKCPRNHPIKMPCHLVDKVTGEDAWVYCDAPCLKRLDCEHACTGQCGSCFQGRLHVSCNRPCNRPLVCGHICKYPCSADCPPCQEICNWKCEHSRCRKKCGLPCNFCKEKCRRKCNHAQCSKLCGNPCSNTPCQLPCKKKLNCGHECIGFCGEPCPPLCRECNHDELTEFTLLGLEEDDDARFVYLEDCQHSIEVQGLEGWLAQDNGEIGMKTCPRCRKPIYNNRRYQSIILDTYKDVGKVKAKYFSSRSRVKRKDIELFLQDPEVASQFLTEVHQIIKGLGYNPSKSKSHAKQKFCSEGELKLYLFQAQVLKKASNILKNSCSEQQTPVRFNRYLPPQKRTPSKHEMRLRPRVEEVVKRVMEKSLIIASQMEEEISCELQRLAVLPAYWNFLEKFSSYSSENLRVISANLETLMDPTVKFDDERDQKVRNLLKESEKYVGGLGITQAEKMMIIKAMGLKQGHWYKCPKGHIYCITECGGAMVESKCPDCGARIGGGSHRLRSDNSVATEMDGARHGAWSEQNNLGNFDLNI